MALAEFVRRPVESEIPNLSEIQAIIVPGSGLHLKGGHPVASFDERLRLIVAAKLYKEINGLGGQPNIIVCGGEVYPGYKLSDISKAKLTGFYGIPEEKVLTADSSLNTIEDIDSAILLMHQHDLKQAIVVSNHWHLTAQEVAEKRGLHYKSDKMLNMFKTYKDLSDAKILNSIRNKQALGVILLRFPFGEVIYKNYFATKTHEKTKLDEYDPYRLQKMTGNYIYENEIVERLK